MSSGNPLCNLRVTRQETESRIPERIGAGEALLRCVKQLCEEVQRVAGYKGPHSPKHEESRDALWTDYSRWNNFNKELLGRLFDSPKLAAGYAAPKNPEATCDVFLA